MKDHRTIWDFCNYYNSHNYNRAGIKFIDETVFYYFNQFPSCLTCKLDQEIVPPDCFDHRVCRYKAHSVKNRKHGTWTFSGRANIETRPLDAKYDIFMCSHHLSVNHYLYLLGFRFMVRPGTDAGFEMNHINGDPTDNRIENAGLLFTKEGDYSHKVFHTKISSLRKELVKWNYESRNIIDGGKKCSYFKKKWEALGITHESVNKRIDEIHEEVKKLKEMRISPDMMEYLDKIQDHVNKGIIFEPDWIKEKIRRYNTAK